jgi:uncharacterized repeat protein (TIGR03833 family)
MGDARIRANIEIGLQVDVIKKQHQKTGELTRGVVKAILTSAPKHTHGIKVMLETNEVGRVKNIIEG